MENPVTLKVGQVFTGFGIGCGIGIGVGRPLNIGAIPMLHQVMSATRGATDAFSGLGMHANSSLRRLGIKNVEAGIGCGVGIGHGFGIGLALKPGVLHRIQSSLSQAMVKMAMKLGIAPGIFDSGSIIPGSLQSSMQMTGGNSGGNVQGTVGNIMQMTSKTTESTLLGQKGDGSLHTLKGTPDVAVGTRSEKVISSFLQNLTSEDTELGDMAGKLRSENNVLQVLLKHQQVIDELMEENKRLRQVLVEDLKVSPSKLLQTSNENRTKYGTPCSDCFECRRRRRKSVK